jgi:UDPglucose 6-dehydrogenase
VVAISVCGAGYVGLVTAACLAELGHDVTCIEIDPDRLELIEQGADPIYEPGLDLVIAREQRAGRLRFTGDYSVAIPSSDIVFVAVITPNLPDGSPDTRFVHDSVRSTLDNAPPGLIIAIKSTVPVGTGDDLADIVRNTGIPGIEVVSNPEFLREGSALADFRSPDRIVVGAESAAAAEAVGRLYASYEAPFIQCDRRSAELAKYAANAFLAMRISFANEVAGICEATSADIEDVARIIGSDQRIGPAFLKAGLGWGGSCFPKDVRALSAMAAAYDCRAILLDAVFEVNARQRERMFERLQAAVRHVEDPTIAVLGLAFKPDTDDIREAPALEIIARLTATGARVRAHDPVAIGNARRVLPHVDYCADPYRVARGADVLLLATEWPMYRNLDWAAIRTQVRGNVVVDGRNALDGDFLAGLGFCYVPVGRSVAGAPDLPVSALGWDTDDPRLTGSTLPR